PPSTSSIPAPRVPKVKAFAKARLATDRFAGQSLTLMALPSLKLISLGRRSYFERQPARALRAKFPPRGHRYERSDYGCDWRFFIFEKRRLADGAIRERPRLRWSPLGGLGGKRNCLGEDCPLRR